MSTISPLDHHAQVSAVPEAMQFITQTNAEWICHEPEDIQKPPSIPSLMQSIAESMCDNYCKYVEQYECGDEERERLYVEHCNNCPINQLI